MARISEINRLARHLSVMRMGMLQIRQINVGVSVVHPITKEVITLETPPEYRANLMKELAAERDSFMELLNSMVWTKIEPELPE